MSAQRSRAMFIDHCRGVIDSLARASSRHFAFAALLGLLALSGVTTASAKELRIENFDAHIDVGSNGTIDVTETIRAHFIGAGWHGLYRSIPVEYVTPQGLNYTLFLSDILAIVDGVIVASSLKVDGLWWNPVDRERAKHFVGRARKAS